MPFVLHGMEREDVKSDRRQQRRERSRVRDIATNRARRPRPLRHQKKITRREPSAPSAVCSADIPGGNARAQNTNCARLVRTQFVF